MTHPANERSPEVDLLVARLLGPAGREVTCEQCFDQLDRYAEVAAAGGDPEAAVPGMRAHLDGCPACAEDHEALVALIAQGPDTERQWSEQ